MRCFINIGIILLCVILFSCHQDSSKEIEKTLEGWVGREIQFPKTDSVNYASFFEKWDYAVISYVDSVGCMSCKLNFRKWKEVIDTFEVVTNKEIGCLLFLQTPYTEKIHYLLKWDHFKAPICFDEDNVFNELNHFPANEMFHTFLLSKERKVLAVGDPVSNPKIRDLYLKIIQGKPIGEEKTTVQTQVAVPETSFTFGDFPWQEAQTHSFEVKNVGHELLVIQDVTTSCGCITVDFPKEPVQPGGTAMVKVTYKADQQEYFNKTVTIYGNAEQFPLSLHVSGNARRLTINN